MPKDLQTQMKACMVNNEEKQRCEKIFGIDQCEECGMVYVQKCPSNYVRVDCALCAPICPSETKSKYNNTWCKKKQIYTRRLFDSLD